MEWEITITSNGNPGLYVGMNMVFIPGNSANGKDFNLLTERTESRLKYLTTNGDQRVVMTGVSYPWLIMGYTREQYFGDSSTAAAVGANPSFAPLLEVVVVDPEARTAIATSFSIRMKYHAQLFGYIGPALS